jgi:hypothetical protein
MKSKTLFLIFFLACFSFVTSQIKKEQEIRINESAFPTNAKKSIAPYLSDVKRIKFYKEFDVEKVSYEAKFKKDRLRYSVEFDENGNLEDVEFIITKVDIPDESFESITKYLALNYNKYRIKKIQQQYLNAENNSSNVLKIAFQNLILPEINYEFIVASKEDKGYVEHEITFNASGEHLFSRRLVKQKYDHVLY